MVTVARGSSDHAATVLAYACGQASGIVPASYPPSLASLHAQRPRVAGQVAVAISQSGRSTDLIASARALRSGGAALVVLTNTPDAPLAREAELVIDIHAGPERAVAATKSFVNSVLAGALLLGHWLDDPSLLASLQGLPDTLRAALSTPMPELARSLAMDDRLLVLGRGPSLGVAEEIALKAMELCGIPALAYSTAELRHGPLQVIRDGHPVYDLTRGPALADTVPLRMPFGAGLHSVSDALLDLVPAYVALEAASRARGLDPDAPDRLRKETVTR
nr:SIS domain-containing protein [Jannaschia sp. S6380]